MGIAGAYRLGPKSGRLLVNTSRTGLGAKAGHDLTIEVTRWHGHARVDTAVPANSSVTIQVDVGSFRQSVDPSHPVRQGGPLSVAGFALIHGGGGSAWDWHLVAPALRERGHHPVAVDLPCEDESAGWSASTDTVVGAVGARGDLVVVGHSLGGFTAPLVCARLPARLLVLVAGMIPAPGEFFSDWWGNSGYEETGSEDVFYHDVPPALAAEARRREHNESSKALQEPWPLTAWPETPTRYLPCRDDRMFPAAWARRHAHERLGIEADEIDSGHYISLSRPGELAQRLHLYAAAIP